MRRICLVIVILGLAGGVARGQQQNPNIRDLKEALQYLKSDKSTDRAFALATMGLMKADAVTASKEIVTSYFDGNADVRQAADLALMNVNPTLYKPVVALARGDDYDAKVQAVKDLAKLGLDAAPTVPALLNFLKDARPGDKVDTIKTLMDIAPKDPSLAAALTQLALKDSDPKVRDAALNALPKTTDASAQMRIVLSALNDAQTADAKVNAIGVLGSIGKGNADVAAVVKNYLNDKSPQVRMAAQKALNALQGK
jgi:HEAT repeat protein